MALYYLKASGEFDAAVRDWENRPAGQKTWQNIKTFISAEHARENKQNKLTAKNFKANMIEEQVEATEELIATLTEKRTQQMETLIKNTTDMMKEMMAQIRNEKKEPSSQSKDEKKQKQEERRKRLMTHRFARTAERNTQLKRRMSAGNSTRIKILALPIGSLLKAPEGARGQ
jgi:hypothetical protein